MTLHVVTITPNHVVCVADRLVSMFDANSSDNRYVELDNDHYKHLSLITDDASAIVSYAGIAGQIVFKDLIGSKTIDWLSKILQKPSTQNKFLINDHLHNIKNEMDFYVGELKTKGIPPEFLKLAIIVVGWVCGNPFMVLFHNCFSMSKHWPWPWESKASEKIQVCMQDFSKKLPWQNKRGSFVCFLGHERTAMKERYLRRALANAAKSNNKRKIYDASVEIIKKVAKSSEGRGMIGENCSGIALGKTGRSEIFNTRENVVYPSVMPSSVISTSHISMYSGNTIVMNSDAEAVNAVSSAEFLIPKEILDKQYRDEISQRVRELFLVENNIYGSKFKKRRLYFVPNKKSKLYSSLPDDIKKIFSPDIICIKSTSGGLLVGNDLSISYHDDQKWDETTGGYWVCCDEIKEREYSLDFRNREKRWSKQFKGCNASSASIYNIQEITIWDQHIFGIVDTEGEPLIRKTKNIISNFQIILKKLKNTL